MFPIMYNHKRSKYNPLRFVLGNWYKSTKIPHFLFDMSDISFEPRPGAIRDAIAAKIVAKHLKKTLDKTPR